MKTDAQQLSRNDETPIEKKESKILAFVKKHKFVFFLLLVIIVILLWAVIKVQTIEKRSSKEKEQLATFYGQRVDSLYLSGMMFTTRVFSWAIRSEMSRQNMEQVNQFFSGFVKEPGIKKIQLIDPLTETVILSSDKKDEGMQVEDAVILRTETTIHLAGENSEKIISPVMGLDKRIGVIVVEFEKAFHE